MSNVLDSLDAQTPVIVKNIGDVEVMVLGLFLLPQERRQVRASQARHIVANLVSVRVAAVDRRTVDVRNNTPTAVSTYTAGWIMPGATVRDLPRWDYDLVTGAGALGLTVLQENGKWERVEEIW